MGKDIVKDKVRELYETVSTETFTSEEGNIQCVVCGEVGHMMDDLEFVELEETLATVVKYVCRNCGEEQVINYKNKVTLDIVDKLRELNQLVTYYQQQYLIEVMDIERNHVNYEYENLPQVYKDKVVNKQDKDKLIMINNTIKELNTINKSISIKDMLRLKPKRIKFRS